MKKYFFLLIAVFVCSNVGAQLVTTTSYTKKSNKAVWYVKAGANIAGAGGIDDYDLSSIFGYHIGIAFDKKIGGSDAFWSLGLQLGTKGFKTEDEYGEIKFNANKIEIPLTFGYKFGVTDDIVIDARIGGFVNYDLWGKYTAEDEEDDWTEEYNLSELSDEYDYTRFGAGITFGVGIWYQKFNFNINYQLGLVEQFATAKERTLMIGVAYAF